MNVLYYLSIKNPHCLFWYFPIYFSRLHYLHVKSIWAAALLKFVLFSISAGLIEIIAFSLLNELTGWSYWPCYLIALILSVLWNFTLNRRYTFQSASNVPVAMLKVFAFYCVFTPVSTIGGSYLADTLHWNEYLVTALNMVCNLTLEFLYDRFYVFRDSIDTRESQNWKKRGYPLFFSFLPFQVYFRSSRIGRIYFLSEI